jgi:hypothetical protein
MFRAIAALGLLLVVAPASAQARTLTGKTGQGKGIRIVTASGYVKRVVVNWKADCVKAGAYSSSTIFRPDDTSVTPDGVTLDDTYASDLGKGYRERVAVHLRGTAAGKGWRGTVSVKAKILRGGRSVDTCRVAKTAWTAGPAEPAGPAKRFVGTGEQRRIATVTTRADGVIESLNVAWRAPCGDHTVFHQSTLFAKTLDVATPDAVADSGTYRDTGSGERYRVTLKVSGKRIVDAAHPERERWEGSIGVKVVVTKRGRHLTNCTLKSAKWRADLL